MATTGDVQWGYAQWSNLTASNTYSSPAQVVLVNPSVAYGVAWANSATVAMAAPPRALAIKFALSDWKNIRERAVYGIKNKLLGQYESSPFGTDGSACLAHYAMGRRNGMNVVPSEERTWFLHSALSHIANHCYASMCDALDIGSGWSLDPDLLLAKIDRQIAVLEEHEVPDGTVQPSEPPLEAVAV